MARVGSLRGLPFMLAPVGPLVDWRALTMVAPIIRVR